MEWKARIICILFFAYNIVRSSCYIIGHTFSTIRSSSVSSSVLLIKKSSIPPPSLERPILQLCRFTLRNTNVRVISFFAKVLRHLLKFSINRKGLLKVSSSTFNQNIDIIEYRGHTKDKDVIVYICGGGFSLIDSADLLLSEHLLPVLRELSTTGLAPSMYTINYSTSPCYDSDGRLLSNYEVVRRQIVEGYNSIISRGNRVVCLVGDSAGGNLVLQLVSQLTTAPPPKVLLLSPYVHLFSTADSYSKFEQDDMLDVEWLARSRLLYLGRELDSFITDWMKKSEADQLSDHFIKSGVSCDIEIIRHINPLLKTDQEIKDMKIRDIMVVIGETELFFDDITAFIGRYNAIREDRVDTYVGANDIHAFPIVMRHPLLMLLQELGLGRALFDYLLPHRRDQDLSIQGTECLQRMSTFIHSSNSK